MHQYAWLELYEGTWCLMTDVRSGPTSDNRKWADRDAAIIELCGEGWMIFGEYPNWLSDKVGLPHICRGYGFRRILH